MSTGPASSRFDGLLRLAGWLDGVNRSIGVIVAWLALAMVLVTFVVVVLRYLFDSGSIALQESVTYMYAILFMLGAAYTLQQDGHVRVDILYQRFSRRGRAWVDLGAA
jgi:TRAP-type mannitol/chloroaromatic compound transport system permease small subunit